MTMKHDLIDNLHLLLEMNVIGSKQYNSRYIGFRSELQTLDFLDKSGRELIGGVYIIPMQNGKEIFASPSILFMVGKGLPTEQHATLFDRLSRIQLEEMYFVSLIEDCKNWDNGIVDGFNTPILIPKCNLFSFDDDSKKFNSLGDDLGHIANSFKPIRRRLPMEQISEDIASKFKIQLGDFKTDDLSIMYVERFIFDGLIGFGRERGIPTDIDSIECIGDEFMLLEIKEKDVSKRTPVGFGMDVRRIQQLRTICRRTSLPLTLVVRQVENQKERIFMNYQTIDFYEFYKQTKNTQHIDGGHGMRSESSYNPTQICPLEFFQTLN